MVRRCGSDEGSHADEKKGTEMKISVSNKIFMVNCFSFVNVLNRQVVDGSLLVVCRAN